MKGISMSTPATAVNVVPLRVPVPVAATQGTLALDLQPRTEVPPAPVLLAGRPRRDLDQWAARYAQAAVEIVGGDRPASQLSRWTSREVYLDLERRALLVARAGNHLPGAGRVQPVRPRVHSVHVCHLGDGAAETSVHVRYGDRSRALAARFERRVSRETTRWVCTALEFA
jgi:hypothetical protein